MHIFLFSLFISFSVQASRPELYPLFRDWAGSWVAGMKADPRDALAMKVQALFDHHQIDRDVLARRVSRSTVTPLTEESEKISSEFTTPIALHAARMKVFDPTDDWMQDDIYCYFLVTDGTLPMGRVTTIQRGLGRGESFHFSASERVLFPFDGEATRAAKGILIVDYGIVESDGDDIKELQKISALILDLAVILYASQDPRVGAIALQLRQEVSALMSAVLAQDHDDRLVTGTISWNNDSIKTGLRNQAWREYQRTHQSRAFLDQWKYRLTFRLLRE